MWITTRQYIYAICLLLFISCGTQDKNEINIKSIEVGLVNKIETQVFNYSDYIDSVKYISLETTDKSLIGHIIDVKLVNDKLFVADKQSVFVFDLDGHLYSKIAAYGRGPGEYLSVSGMDVNISNNEINVYDVTNRVMLVYSLDGSFLRKVAIEGLPRDFAVLSNGDYLFYTPDFMEGTYHGVWQTDKNGQFLKQHIKMDSKIRFITLSSNYFVHVNDSVVGLVGPQGYDYVLHFTENGYKKAYNISVDMDIPKNILEKDSDDWERVPGEVYSKTYMETDNYLYMLVSDLGYKQVFVHYDKVNDINYQRTMLVNSDTMDPFIPGNKVPYYFAEQWAGYGVIIGTISSTTITSIPYYKEGFPHIDENSNPVIGIYYFK